MSARQEISINSSIQKLGIIAGAGAIPQQLKDSCQSLGIECFVIGLQGNTDQIVPDYWSRIGQAGKIIERLKAENIHDIVMIGAVKRPNLFDLWPDWITFKFFLTCWIRSCGDNSMLQAARQALEVMGFHLHGAHKFMPNLLMPLGSVGKHQSNAQQALDIQLGIKQARALGEADIGQGVLVKDGQIIAQENQKGTSWMLKKHGAADSILVKMCKPQQDLDLDLPTIGPETVRLCAAKGMAGIVGQAGCSLLVEQEKVRQLADEAGVFVLGVSLDD